MIVREKTIVLNDTDKMLYHVTTHKKSRSVLSTIKTFVTDAELLAMHDVGNEQAEQDVRLPELLAARETEQQAVAE